MINNKRGQSLVELASFGAVLLLCLGVLIQYGMQANYQQNLQMQTFRKALKTAYYRSGPAAAASLAVTHDKAIPNPSDPWGFAERRPISASASVTWDSNIQALYEYGNPNDLPRSIIEINDTLALTDADLRDGAIDTIDSSKGAFTTGSYSALCPVQIMIVVENTPEQRMATREEYREVWVNRNDVIVKNRKTKDEDPGEKYAYVKIDGLVHTVSSADVDGDRQVETIISADGDEEPCDEEGYCGRLVGFEYVDYQIGEIDTDYAAILPWETDKAGASLDAQQGLLNKYTTVKNDNNTMVKTETPANLNTTTTVGGQQTVTHTIRTNTGGTRDYVTTFQPEFGPSRVTVPESVDAGWSVSK